MGYGLLIIEKVKRLKINNGVILASVTRVHSHHYFPLTRNEVRSEAHRRRALSPAGHRPNFNAKLQHFQDKVK